MKAIEESVKEAEELKYCYYFDENRKLEQEHFYCYQFENHNEFLDYITF